MERTNRKRVCDLVINSNLRPILPPFQSYCRFSAEKSDPTPFHQNFGGVPLGLDCR